MLAAITPIVARGRATASVKRNGKPRELSVKPIEVMGETLYIAALGGDASARAMSLNGVVEITRGLAEITSDLAESKSAFHPAKVMTPPGFRTASIAALLLGPKFGRLAEDIRADCVAEWVKAEAAGNRRLARWLRVRTSVVIVSNAIAYMVRLSLGVALKFKQLFFG
jgi:hypothetical protein